MNQRDVANVEELARLFCGRHLAGVNRVEAVPTTSKYVRSADNLDADVELKSKGDVEFLYKGQAKSETGASSSGRQDGIRWFDGRAQSDSGVELGNKKHDETIKRQNHEAAMAE